MNRTDPSARRTLKPPGWDEPAPKSDGAAAGSNGKSSGLVQGTAFLASTTMIVFDVPSVISASLVPLPFSKNAPLPDEYLVGRREGLDPGSTRAEVHWRHLLDQRLVVRAVPRLVQLELLIERSPARYTAGSPPASSRAACPACR